MHTLRGAGYWSGLIGEQHISKDPDVIGYDRVVKIKTTRVWMTRADKVAQAVSPWRAIQSWSWSSDQRPDPHDGHLRYSYPAIRYLLDDIVAHESEWQRYFDQCGVRPHVVVYEQFRNAYQDTIAGILNLVGVDADQVSVPASTRRRQADALSAEWVERYLADSAAGHLATAEG